MMIEINKIIKPAIANPLGFLNTPIIENNAPRNQRIQPRTGTQHNTIATIDKMKPVIPMPFDCFTSFAMIIIILIIRYM